MRDSIKFLLGNEARELRGIDPTLTVLDYLRLVEYRVGTKEGCAEGDCGACSVVVGSPNGGKIRYRAVNSCIQFMATLDGHQLITVEDLRDAEGSLHPVQRAMVQEHGSQCGFCTPGFVMSLFALFHDDRDAGGPPELNRINDALAGNLCRCTGYGPIVAAARAMGGLAQGPDQFETRESDTLAALTEMRDEETIHIVGEDGRELYAPASVEALADLLRDHPEAVMVAGATDVGLWVTKDQRKLSPVIYLARVAPLRGIRETEAGFEIGSLTPYTDAAPVIAALYPDFGEIVRRTGSVQVRNLGTIGGNIANGSPIGDMLPPLIAAGATLILRRGEKRRSLALENFFIDYGKQDLKSGEFVETVILPRPSPDNRLYCYKISKRFDQDISAVLGAFSLTIRSGMVAEARIAFGGMAATPKRAAGAEDALSGGEWSLENVQRAMKALESDFAPVDDMRASARYRMAVARNLLMKAFHESCDGAPATRVLTGRETAHA